MNPPEHLNYCRYICFRWFPYKSPFFFYRLARCEHHTTSTGSCPGQASPRDWLIPLSNPHREFISSIQFPTFLYKRPYQRYLVYRLTCLAYHTTRSSASWYLRVPLHASPLNVDVFSTILFRTRTVRHNLEWAHFSSRFGRELRKVFSRRHIILQ